jgi:negative regulator of flagellin synthesis FlgM
MEASVGNLRRALQFPRELSITSSQLDNGGLYMANTINRVTGNSATSIGTSRAGQQSKQDASLNTAHPQSEGGDEVQITNRAANLATLGQSLSASSPVDEARVARISQALADGSYRISAQQIATGLMQSDHALEQIGL